MTTRPQTARRASRSTPAVLARGSSSISPWSMAAGYSTERRIAQASTRVARNPRYRVQATDISTWGDKRTRSRAPTASRGVARPSGRLRWLGEGFRLDFQFPLVSAGPTSQTQADETRPAVHHARTEEDTRRATLRTRRSVRRVGWAGGHRADSRSSLRGTQGGFAQKRGQRVPGVPPALFGSKTVQPGRAWRVDARKYWGGCAPCGGSSNY